MDRIGDTDRADEFDGISVDEYAEHRGLQVANPKRKEKKQTMATKAELQEQLDNINEVLNGAYTPEASREDIAAAVGEALDILNGEEDDADESEDESEDDSDDSEEEDEEGE